MAALRRASDLDFPSWIFQFAFEHATMTSQGSSHPAIPPGGSGRERGAKRATADG
jgi:hypothetical protein